MESQPYRTLTPIFDELHDERVTVRPYRLEDAEALRDAVIESRERLLPWLPWASGHQTIEETRDVILRAQARWLLREDFMLGVWRRDTAQFLGGTGIHVRNWEIGYFEIGYWLRDSAEGHGYMTAAVRLVAAFAAESFHANRIEIRCDARNTRSAAVAERLGFVREAEHRNDSRAADGPLRNTLVYALIPGDPAWPTPGRREA